MPRFAPSALFLGVVLSLAMPLHAADKQLIRVGLNVQGVLRSGDTVAANNDPITHLLAHLNTSPAYRFEVVRFESADDVYDALKARKVDVARFGPTYYVKASFEFEAVPLVGDKDELVSVLVVKTGSPVKKVADLAGRKVALGYKNSTTSHLVPLLLLSKGQLSRGLVTEDAAAAKADPKKVLVDFVGGHDKVAAEVLSGRADAGGMIVNEYERNRTTLRTLDVSEPFPGTPVVAHPAMSAAARAEIVRLATTYVPPGPDGPFGKGFRVVRDADFNKVRFLCQVVLGVKYLK
jgi:ABC-type phosphate/phosphonate transport system substrate-binding protein